METTTQQVNAPTGPEVGHGTAGTESPSQQATLLLTLDEVARELRCARRSVERQVACHRLPVVHLGRSVRVARGDLERFVAGLREPPPDPAQLPWSREPGGLEAGAGGSDG
jgi:excisionase family DNA binding protein